MIEKLDKKIIGGSHSEDLIILLFDKQNEIIDHLEDQDKNIKISIEWMASHTKNHIDHLEQKTEHKHIFNAHFCSGKASEYICDCGAVRGSDIDTCEQKTECEHKEKWNENVETCSGCGIHWKKIGKSCPVCYAPKEKHEEEREMTQGETKLAKGLDDYFEEQDQWEEKKEVIRGFIKVFDNTFERLLLSDEMIDAIYKLKGLL